MQAVLFDLGGVLVRYDHDRCLAGMAALCSAAPEQVDQLLHEMSRQLSVGTMEADDALARLRTEAGAVDDADALVAGYAAGLARDEEGLAFALELEARPTLLVGVLSNTNEFHVRWLDEHVPELRDFDLVMMSNEIHLRKPDPAVFRFALEMLDLPANAVLFVDDAAANVEAAQAQGMAGIVHRAWQESRARIEEWLRA